MAVFGATLDERPDQQDERDEVTDSDDANQSEGERPRPRGLAGEPMWIERQNRQK